MYFSQQDLSSRAEYVIHSKNLGILYSTENVMTERTKCRALIINRYRKKGSHNEKYLSIVSDTVVQLKKVENPRYIYVFCINTFDVLLVHAWSNRASFEPREWSKEWQKWKTHSCMCLKFVAEKSMPKSEPSEVNRKWTGTKVVCGNKIVWRSSIRKRASKWQIRWRRSLFKREGKYNLEIQIRICILRNITYCSHKYNGPSFNPIQYEVSSHFKVIFWSHSL